MAYVLTWKQGTKRFISKKTFRTKARATSVAKFTRQLDDDLPKSQRDKSLKTYRAIKKPVQKKMRR
jgi:hypothetical protein|tara:strand:- start:2485 stop:2682 length:198 start_codon:yes stop_codon:yes gene_type:complete